ncbi:MAG TPA: invasion associated locus B family protein [Arenibaculum sp.]|nr:invasion associated locus B family protein [Arenibaculum sp.]
MSARLPTIALAAAFALPGAALGLAAVLGAAVPASAQQEAEERRFGDWQLVCPAGDAGARCFITQRQTATDTGLDLLGAAIFYLPGQSDPTIELRIAPQADPQQPIALQVDDARPLTIGIEQCNESYCATTGTLSAGLIAQFRAGNRALISFVAPPDGQRIAVPLSLQGFTAAMRALDERAR